MSDNSRAHVGQMLQDRIAQDIQMNVNHAAVCVPWSISPFTNQVHELIFRQSLIEIQAAGVVPKQFGMLSSEWGDEGYPSYKIISMGQRSKKNHCRAASSHLAPLHDSMGARSPCHADFFVST